jgi:hypothetical protein
MNPRRVGQITLAQLSNFNGLVREDSIYGGLPHSAFYQTALPRNSANCSGGS